jgi:hypothetical protein
MTTDEVKQYRQHKIASHSQFGCKNGGLYAVTGNFDLIGLIKIQIVFDLIQGQNSHAKRPKTEITDAGFMAGYQLGVGQGIL